MRDPYGVKRGVIPIDSQDAQCALFHLLGCPVALSIDGLFPIVRHP